MGLHVANSLCICLWKKSGPFQFIFSSASDRPQRLGPLLEARFTIPALFFCHSSHCQGTFPNHFTRIMLFNPTTCLHRCTLWVLWYRRRNWRVAILPGVTGLIKGGPWIPVCPLSSMSLSTLPQDEVEGKGRRSWHKPFGPYVPRTSVNSGKELDTRGVNL